MTPREEMKIEAVEEILSQMILQAKTIDKLLYAVSTALLTLNELKTLSNRTLQQEMWRIDQAIEKIKKLAGEKI